MFNVTDDEFHSLMERAMQDIPVNFKDRLENIVFISEPYPNQQDLERLGLEDKRQLLGLYSGIPYTHRNTNYTSTLPDRIILFKDNIERVCYSQEELVEKIKEVLIHEIAHYFGMNEEEVRAAGY